MHRRWPKQPIDFEKVESLFVFVFVAIPSAALFALVLVDLKSAFFLHR